jgi:histidinol-phosphate aminotransferase
MFDITKLTRCSILARAEYTPNKPPDAIMLELGLKDFVDLATNENPNGISPRAYGAILQEAKESLHHYPESTCYDLVKKLAEVHGLPSDCFLVDNGLDAVVSLLGLTFLDPVDEIIVANPTFHAYENTAEKMGAAVTRIELTEDYRVDVDRMIAAATSKTKIIFVCNPNNPTGTVITNLEFRKLIENVPPSVLVVVDEAFYEFVEHPEYPQSISYLNLHPNLIVLRSFSKTMALAGLRIGYAIASPEIIRMMLRAREPFPVNRLAQVAAIATLDDREFVEKTVEINRISRNKMGKALEALGLHYVPSQTNFIFVDLGQPVEPVWKAMFAQGVVVRRLDGMGAPNSLRICLGKQRDLQRAINALANALGKEAPEVFNETIDD